MKQKLPKSREARKAIQFIVNRLASKYKIHPDTTYAVLKGIADLRWDWEGSEYDLYGLQIEEALTALGRTNCPVNKRQNLV